MIDYPPRCPVCASSGPLYGGLCAEHVYDEQRPLGEPDPLEGA
jgi:hypothetical protein